MSPRPRISIRLLSAQSDKRLVELAQQGHERAFEALVQRYRRPLLRYCRHLLSSEGRAEDVLQQALLQAWLALKSGAEVRDPKSWLYRIAHNVAVNTLRRSPGEHSQLTETLQGTGVGESELDRMIAMRTTLASMATLPQMQREVIFRTALVGHSHEEVASALEITDGAVRGLLYRARTTLRAAVTALTPTPLLTWAASAGNRTAPLSDRVGELVAGAGTAGLGGLLVKGGIVAITAGALVTGASIVPTHQPLASARSESAVRPTNPTSTPVEVGLTTQGRPSGHATPPATPRGTGSIPLTIHHTPAATLQVPPLANLHATGGAEGQVGAGATTSGSTPPDSPPSGAPAAPEGPPAPDSHASVAPQDNPGGGGQGGQSADMQIAGSGDTQGASGGGAHNPADSSNLPEGSGDVTGPVATTNGSGNETPESASAASG